jgi:hypothetical protein
VREVREQSMRIKSIDQFVNNSFVQIISKVNVNSNAIFKAAFVGGLVNDVANDIQRIIITNFKLTREIRFGNANEFAPELSR